eukprot:CAMPEP_0184490944 /NCGR_PEP_ID=MMETSP0113_2-20130426/19258_1 /TAXON_ID=91329 /ORGANISM="Norrisiella sphaerica, Strain BC52" /LENGTH=860 /DNA_ID=CAMNT_0026875087 /DNA_START=430 /DNA_END=3012 /DNA_ORIENTATION=+
MICAVVSFCTAALLPILLPRIIALPALAAKLKTSVRETQREKKLIQAQADLLIRVDAAARSIHRSTQVNEIMHAVRDSVSTLLGSTGSFMAVEVKNEPEDLNALTRSSSRNSFFADIEIGTPMLASKSQEEDKCGIAESRFVSNFAKKSVVSQIIASPYAKLLSEEQYRHLQTSVKVITHPHRSSFQSYAHSANHLVSAVPVIVRPPTAADAKSPRFDNTTILIITKHPSAPEWSDFELAVLDSIATHASIAMSQAILAERDAQRAERLSEKNKELVHLKDKAEQMGKAKEDFMAIVSHELRTPLYAVVSMADLLLDSAFSAEQLGMLELIKSSSNHLISIINDILDSVKYDNSGFRLEQREVNLRSVIEAGQAQLYQKAISKGLYLLSNVEPDVPEMVMMDETRVLQILINITSNAIKFTERGGIFIDVHLMKEEEEEITLRVDIRDTGPGISPEALGRIFERFAQADESTARRYGGTGLGLAISRQLAAKMGGSITVESKVGKGTTFILTIKLSKAKSVDTEERKKLKADLNCMRCFVLTEPSTCPGDSLAAQARELEATYIKSSFAKLTSKAYERANDLLQDFHASVEFQAKSKSPMVFSVVIPTWLHDKVENKDATMYGFLREIASKKIRRHSIVVFFLCSSKEDSKTLEKALTSANVFNHPRCSYTILIYPLRASNIIQLVRNKLQQPSLDTNLSSPMRRDMSQFQSLRVLIVDDSKVNQKVTRMLLKKRGVRNVFSAMNGKIAVDMCCGEGNLNKDRIPFDLVLMDLHMPTMDGREATKAIREWESQNESKTRSRFLVCALTAAVLSQSELESLMKLGFDCFLSKPFKVGALVEVLRKGLGRDCAKTADQAEHR